MLNQQALISKLSALASVYRPDITAEQLKLLTWEYYESLADLTDAQFFQGVIEAKKVCRFLPTPADIRSGYENAPAQRQNQLAIPACDSSSDSWERQQAMAKLFIRSLEGDMQAREFFSRGGA